MRRFHFALSFSKSSRRQAEQLANELREIGYQIFYDRWFEHEMLGTVGTDYLREIYTTHSEYCVVLIDAQYDERRWTVFEREVIEARAFDNKSDTLLPIMLGDYRPSWLAATRIYCDFGEKGIRGVVALLTAKRPLRMDRPHLRSSSHQPRQYEIVQQFSDSAPCEARVLVLVAGGTIALVQDREKGCLCPANSDQFCEFIPDQVRPCQLDFAFLQSEQSVPELLDSSSYEPGIWSDLARIIAENYQTYDGFVVLGGADMLCFTATALSFMLSDLSKPVVLTSALAPLSEPRSDALQNIINALSVASHVHAGLPLVPEVVVVHGDVVLRGNRTSRTGFHSYRGMFDSPNFPPLGIIGEQIEFRRDLLRPSNGKRLSYKAGIATEVALIDLHPGLNEGAAQRLVFSEGDQDALVNGVVLAIYGAGNVPEGSWILEFLDQCRLRRIHVVAASRMRGGLPDEQARPRSLLARGIVGALDMTVEAALIKLMWLLGTDTPYERVSSLFKENLRGEISEPTRLFRL